MNFFQLLKSLDDLLFEVVSWIAFYPITLMRSLLHPVCMMGYADGEIDKPVELRFDSALSPPIFLLLTVLVSHAIELATVGQSELVAQTRGLAGLINDNTSLILMRLVGITIFPLVFAIGYLVAVRRPVTRSALERPFFAQCYASAPYSLLLGISSTLIRVASSELRLVGYAVALASVLSFILVESIWFRKAVQTGYLATTAIVFLNWVAAVAAMLGLGWLVVGGLG